MRGKSRYTATHGIQQEPMKSTREGNCFRPVSDALVRGSRTITRTIFASRRIEEAIGMKHHSSAMRMKKLNGYVAATARTRNGLANHYFGTWRRRTHLRRAQRLHHKRADLSGAAVRSGCHAIRARAPFRGRLRLIAWPARTPFLSCPRPERFALQRNQANQSPNQGGAEISHA